MAPPPKYAHPVPKIVLPSVVRAEIADESSWFLITVLAAHGMTAPVVPSSDPIPSWVEPSSVLKLPPTMTRPLAGCTTMLRTSRSAAGAQGRTEPVVVSTAASRVRVWPPNVVK